MKNSRKNMLVLLGLAALTGSLASCNGGGGGTNSTITTVNILLFNGTSGRDWLNQSTKRFAEANKETSFEDGKTGITFKIQQAKGVAWNSEIKSTGNDIMIYEYNPDIFQLSAQGYLLDLDDIVRPKEASIESGVLERLKGPDGKYYALPHYEWFPGVSYDKDLFNEKNFYFADPSVDAEDVEVANTPYGTGRFIADKNIQKSVGPNGIRGDYDDGLPSSLEEFNILCHKLYSDGVSPILLCGSGQYYSWKFPLALWASLTGPEGMRNTSCEWSNAELDMVTGWKDDELFAKGSGLKTPVTEKVVLNEENGYKMYDMANRYYSLAFMEMAIDNKWLDPEALADSNQSPTAAMNWFINGHSNKRYGMYWDGSYWCHEAADVGTFETYRQMNPTNPDRHTAFMPLPTQLTGQVTEGKGKKPALVNTGSTLTFANARVKTNGKEKAVKAFLNFLYSNEELSAFSELTGLTAPIDYTWDRSKLNNTYYDDLATLRAAGEVIQPSSISERYKKNLMSFVFGYSMTISSFRMPNGVQNAGGYLDPFTKYNCTSDYIFDNTRFSKSVWDSMSK